MPQRGEDVHHKLYITPQEALTGIEKPYFHKGRGKRVMLKIPTGIKDGQQITYRKLGKVGKHGGETGNLRVTVHIHIPFQEKIKNFLFQRMDNRKTDRYTIPRTAIYYRVTY